MSNGEFLPLAAGPVDVRLARAVLDCDAAATDALGMDRRLFLLTTINLAACSSRVLLQSGSCDLRQLRAYARGATLRY